jgi:hypothetical protein
VKLSAITARTVPRRQLTASGLMLVSSFDCCSIVDMGMHAVTRRFMGKAHGIPIWIGLILPRPRGQTLTPLVAPTMSAHIPGALPGHPDAGTPPPAPWPDQVGDRKQLVVPVQT